MTRLWTPLALALLCVPCAAQAQEPAPVDEATRAELARMRDEAIALDDAGRHALAAERYLALHDAMRRAGLPRAPVALWNAGLALTHLPGRERDARDTLQRFLDESTPLTDDAQIRDWRSTALEHIAELDARIGPDDRVSEQDPSQGNGSQPTSNTSVVSPVGPVLLGVGGAAVVAGLIVGGLALDADSTFASMCPSRTECGAVSRGAYEDARALGAAADALWIGGAVVAATGLILTLLLQDSRAESPATVAAACTPEGCIGSVGGRF